jgi:hypothetical protein
MGALVSTLLPIAILVLAIVVTVQIVRTRRAVERIEARLAATEPSASGRPASRPDGSRDGGSA